MDDSTHFISGWFFVLLFITAFGFVWMLFRTPSLLKDISKVSENKQQDPKDVFAKVLIYTFYAVLTVSVVGLAGALLVYNFFK